MRLRLRAIGLATAGVLLALPVLADTAAEKPAEKLSPVEQMKRDDPARYARLVRDYQAFRALPPERQEAIRKMHADLQAEKAGKAQHLEGVLERYVAWLDRLPEADRKSVLAAEDRNTRLKRVRELRVKEWLARLPRPTAERFQKAGPKERARIWDDFWDDRADWQIANRFSDDRGDRFGSLLALSPQLPTRPEALSEDARDFIEKKLRPLLTAEEERALRDAEGKWPRYPRQLVELADAHPLNLVGPVGPTKITDLPPKFRDHLEKGGLGVVALRRNLTAVEGKWPAFGAVLHEWYEASPIRKLEPGLPKTLTPARPHDFPGAVSRFIEDRLAPALDKDEMAQLAAAEGKWPRYPQTVLDLAQKHNLLLPTGGPGLPPREGWERYRLKRAAPLE